MRRIGPRMAEVVRLAHNCPGHAMFWYAVRVGLHGHAGGKWGGGYAIMHRAHKAGLINLFRSPKHRGTYIVVPAGWNLPVSHKESA